MLPSSLIGTIEAPMPILAGITRKDYDELEETYEEPLFFDGFADEEGQNELEDDDPIKRRTWVFLDCLN